MVPGVAIIEEAAIDAEIDYAASFSMKKRKRSTKSVGFTDKSEIHMVIHHESSCSLSSSSWYTHDEYSQFEDEVRDTIRIVRGGNTTTTTATHNDDGDDCSRMPVVEVRGLEKYLTTVSHGEKRLRTAAHYVAILHEQHRQGLMGMKDSRMLQLLSMIHSKWATQKALELAQQDAQDARTYQNEPNNNNEHATMLPLQPKQPTVDTQRRKKRRLSNQKHVPVSILR